MKISNIFKLFLFSIFTLFSVSIIARDSKPLNLYEQPDTKAKTVATVAAGQPIIPIFTQGDWIKVADPSNGNVGWIEKKILNDQNYPSLLIKTFGENTKDKTSSGYQMIEINLPNKEQMQNLMQNFQTQQKQFQQLFNQIMQQNVTDFNRMLNAQPEIVPILQPILIAPDKEKTTDKKQ